MLQFILKIRDKSWFYTNQLYQNDSEVSNFRDFKIRFAMFFVPPMVLINSIIFWHLKYTIGLSINLDENDFLTLVPLAILGLFIFIFIYNFIFKKISLYPIDNKNNSGYVKNILFLFAVILLELIISYLSLVYFF